MSAEQRPARRHHVVSKFYLRYFADDDGMLTTIELPGRTFPQSVESASVRIDFYTGRNNAGQETDAAEKAFGEIEGPAATAWRLVADGMWPLADAERGAVAAWIALHLLRTNATRQSMTEMGSDLRRLEIVFGGRERLREALREAGQPHDDEAVDREWIDLHRDPAQVNVDANHHLEHIGHLLPWVTEHLLGRWWLLTAFDRKRLGTSDHPVVVVPNDRDAEQGMGTGIETADTIILPLTRRLGLALSRRDTLASELADLDDMKQGGSAATALWGNSVTSRHAHRGAPSVLDRDLLL
jgi:Protein of unknown function (DUF4238)